MGPAQVQLMITNAMRATLVDELDYTDEEVSAMRPEIAAQLIKAIGWWVVLQQFSEARGRGHLRLGRRGGDGEGERGDAAGRSGVWEKAAHQAERRGEETLEWEKAKEKITIVEEEGCERSFVAFRRSRRAVRNIS